MNAKADTLLESLNTFYRGDPKNVQHLEDVLNKRKGVSLRNLEWFITNYARSKNLMYEMPNGQAFVVHCAYKSSLDGYSKKLFDPFCRTQKFENEVPHTDTKIQTTVAQLNFIRWCIKKNILQYLTDNKKVLESGKK